MTSQHTWIWLLLFLGLAFPAQAQQYHFRNYSVEDGLAQSQVFGIFQDSKGYIWVATNGGGVSRFDGLEFVNFNQQHGLLHNRVWSIAEDKTGNIWFGTATGASRFDGQHFTHFTDSNGLVPGVIRKIYGDATGDLWFCSSRSGISRFDGEQFHTFTTDNGLMSNLGRNVQQDRYGTVWLVTGNGISTYKSETDMATPFEMGGQRSGFQSIAIDTSGHPWLGVKNQLMTLQQGQFQTYGAEVGFPEKMTILSLHIDRNNHIWVGTLGDGVYHFDHHTATRIDKTNGLAEDIVYDIIEDKEGNLWFGTDGGGLSKLGNQAFVHYTTQDGLTNNQVMALEEDAQGRLWLGTFGGGLNRFTPPSFKSTPTPKGMEYIWSIHNTTDNTIYLGSNGGRIGWHDGQAWQQATWKDPSICYALLQDRQQRLWMGSIHSVHLLQEGEKTTFSKANSGKAIGNVYAIAEDQKGAIWIASSKGVFFYESGQLKSLQEQTGFDEGAVMSLVVDPNGAIWLGTMGDGLLYYNPKVPKDQPFKSITQKDGLTDNAISSMLIDRAGYLWVGTIKYLNQLNLQAFHQEGAVSIKTYGKLEGFKGAECSQNALYQDSHGLLWIGTANGVMRYDPSADQQNKVAPEVRLQNIRLAFEAIDWTTLSDSLDPKTRIPVDLQLPYDQNHLTFDFLAISHTIPEKVRYQYVLEGLDKSWSPVTAARSATYPSIPPGHYHFRVKACNNDGIWTTQSTDFHFTILPPFWQTWWFYLLCVIVLLMAVYIYAQLRVRQLKARQKALEQKVAERTQELSLAYEDLKALEEHKELMTHLIVHDLKNPINTIIGYSKQAPSNYNLDTIGLAGEKMNYMVSNILDIQKFEEAEIKLQREWVMLEDLLQQAVEQVALLAQQQGVGIEMVVPHGLQVHADMEYTIRIVVNLLTNAMKHSPAGEKVILKATAAEAVVTVACQDSGKGIPADKLDLLFDKYAQVASKKTGHTYSTGLGLTFCKLAVEAQGGKIWVVSELGKGSTFYFSLPGKDIAAASQEGTSIYTKAVEPDLEGWLTEADKTVIRQLSPEFSQLKVFHVSQNIALLEQLPNQGNTGKWRQAMETAVYGGDGERYRQLLDMIKSD